MTGFCVWLTGLPCSGKTTIANGLADLLRHKYGRSVTVLDGDRLRNTISADLGFAAEDRRKQAQRVAYVAAHVVEAGGVAIVALVSPYESDRVEAYRIIGDGVTEVLTHASRDVCRARDVKGMWAKAASGEIKGFTGHDAPYEVPMRLDVLLDTENETPAQSVALVESELQIVGVLPSQRYALFIGRWSPFHNGHKHIIDEARKGGPVAIGVRCSPDAYGVGTRIAMIRAVYPDAYVFPVPDIESVHIGRNVGYDVVRYEVPEDVAAISATAIREKFAGGDESWRDMVPDGVAEIMGVTR